MLKFASFDWITFLIVILAWALIIFAGFFLTDKITERTIKFWIKNRPVFYVIKWSIFILVLFIEFCLLCWLALFARE